MINTIRYGGQAKRKNQDGKEEIIKIPPAFILNQWGAFLDVLITHPKIIRDELQKKGNNIPAKQVKALIDTGASSSIITPQVAAELQLIHTGYQNVSSVQDEQERPVYYGSIQFAWGAGKEIPLIACPLKAHGFECLIGRDILIHWNLIYNGFDGFITICD